MSDSNDFYVYVYIDPRNHDQFYYGKGKGIRKDAHLKDKSDTEKVLRIADIRKVGQEPIVRSLRRTLLKKKHSSSKRHCFGNWENGRLIRPPGISRSTSARKTRCTRNCLDSTTNTNCITTTAEKTKLGIGMTTKNTATFQRVGAPNIVMPCADFTRRTSSWRTSKVMALLALEEFSPRPR